MTVEFKEFDVVTDNFNWEWIFLTHEGKLHLYPMEFYNGGLLSEPEKKGDCSFYHDPETWDLSRAKFVRNISPTVKIDPPITIEFNGLIQNEE